MATYGKKKHILPALPTTGGSGRGAGSKRPKPRVRGMWSYLVNLICLEPAASLK